MDLYVASGLLTYKGSDLWSYVTSALAPYARRLVHKEMFLSAKELQGLHSEQLALLDFLVLVHSNNFVGISTSTFSVFLREYRHVTGFADRNSSHLVHAAVIGTEPLFERSAVLL